ncbi:hypothetical protein GGX14DRAFT_454732, partial [Mycena pura]
MAAQVTVARPLCRPRSATACLTPYVAAMLRNRPRMKNKVPSLAPILEVDESEPGDTRREHTNPHKRARITGESIPYTPRDSASTSPTLRRRLGDRTPTMELTGLSLSEESSTPPRPPLVRAAAKVAYASSGPMRSRSRTLSQTDVTVVMGDPNLNRNLKRRRQDVEEGPDNTQKRRRTASATNGRNASLRPAVPHGRCGTTTRTAGNPRPQALSRRKFTSSAAPPTQPQSTPTPTYFGKAQAPPQFAAQQVTSAARKRGLDEIQDDLDAAIKGKDASSSRPLKKRRIRGA